MHRLVVADWRCRWRALPREVSWPCICMAAGHAWCWGLEQRSVLVLIYTAMLVLLLTLKLYVMCHYEFKNEWGKSWVSWYSDASTTKLFGTWWITAHQSLTSFSDSICVLPRYSLSTFGRRAFSLACPTVWNSLPENVRDPECSADTYRRSLKTSHNTSVSSASEVFLWECTIIRDTGL